MGLPIGQSFGDIFSNVVPSSQKALACVKLKKKLTKTLNTFYITV